MSSISIAGYRKGFEDSRGKLFFEMLRMIEAHHPAAIFMENVKNLVSPKSVASTSSVCC